MSAEVQTRERNQSDEDCGAHDERHAPRKPEFTRNQEHKKAVHGGVHRRVVAWEGEGAPTGVEVFHRAAAAERHFYGGIEDRGESNGCDPVASRTPRALPSKPENHGDRDRENDGNIAKLGDGNHRGVARRCPQTPEQTVHGGIRANQWLATHYVFKQAEKYPYCADQEGAGEDQCLGFFLRRVE